MNNTDLIISYSEGKISHEEFEAELWIHPELWDEIQKLLPADIDNPDCQFRRIYGNMQGLETNNYRIKSFLTAFSYSGLKTHGLICSLVKYSFPDIICHTPIENSPDDMLDRLQLDYIGGAEVDAVIRALILNNHSKALLKKQLKNAFPCLTRNHPNWVQEPEWPMGKNSPMRFVSQSHEGDLFRYTFEDVDTGEQRIVEQFS